MGQIFVRASRRAKAHLRRSPGSLKSLPTWKLSSIHNRPRKGGAQERLNAIFNRLNRRKQTRGIVRRKLKIENAIFGF